MDTLSVIWIAALQRKAGCHFAKWLHCNPNEVAYKTHCLSHCCLRSFPQTDSTA